MKEQIVSMENVSIHFGSTKALKDVSFQIYKGEIFGFLGPSGAGKTTTIKLLTKQHSYFWKRDNRLRRCAL